MEGAWSTVLVIPSTGAKLEAVHHYFAGIDRQALRGSRRRIDLRDHARPVAIVPIARRDQLSRKAVEQALRLSPDLTALHVTTLDAMEDGEEVRHLRREWHGIVQEPAVTAGLPCC